MRVLLLASTEVHNHIPGYVPHEEAAFADELAEESGRLCYRSWNRPNLKTSTNRGYLANIISQGHFSILEHASATFYIDGVSRNLSHELVRHRHLSFSELSQRFVDSSSDPFIHPPAYQEFGIDFDMQLLVSRYQQDVQDLEAEGLERKQARQAARSVLPGGLNTSIVVTGNHRAWRDMLPKRLSPSADLEFQLVARELLRLLKEIAPSTYQDMEIPE